LFCLLEKRKLRLRPILVSSSIELRGADMTADLMHVGIPSSSIFTFNKEDHTLGNLLRSRLLQNPHVIFAGYKVCPPWKPCFLQIYFEVLRAFLESSGMQGSDELSQVPHPLVPKFELRVQTDGEITPKDALLAACHDLVKDLGILSREFTKEYELRKMVGATQQQQNGTAEGA
jgi:DNA-directed RNA polymerase II subunit RPB11